MFKKAFYHIKSLVVIGSVSPRWSSQSTRRASLSFACLSIVQSCQLYKHTCKGLFICILMVFVLSWISFHGTNTIRNISIYISIYLSINLSIYISIYLSIYLFIYFHLSIVKATMVSIEA